MSLQGPEMLAWLRTRRSVRAFLPRPIDRAILTRLVEAATTAPSSTNRQPWRFAMITAARLLGQITYAVRARTSMMREVIAKSAHAEEFGSYGDFFFEPLQTATAIVIPEYRDYPDAIAHMIAQGGGDLPSFTTPSAMQAELCGTSAAVMALLLQAHAEGLGACWMAGPMVARKEIEALLDIAAPWRMVGAIALGYPAASPGGPSRKPLDRVVSWFEDGEPERKKCE
jgi:nitroreductase